MKVVGADGVKRSIDDAISYIAGDIEADFQDWGNETVNIAKKIHKFGNPYSKKYAEEHGTNGTGNANASMKAEAKGASVKIYIDPDGVSVNSKRYGKFNYAMALHEGTKYITGDPFLERAIEKNKNNLEKRILKSLKRILG